MSREVEKERGRTNRMENVRAERRGAKGRVGHWKRIDAP